MAPSDGRKRCPAGLPRICFARAPGPIPDFWDARITGVTLTGRLLRTVPAIESAAVSGEGHEALRLRIAAAIQKHVGHDIACVATLDPVTTMWTDCAIVGAVRDHDFEAELFDAEYRQDDVAKMADVARRARPVAVLSAETGGDLARSARFRAAFGPAGWSDELRLVLLDAGVAWASVQLGRTGKRTFSEEDARALAELSEPLGRAIRHSLLRTAAERASEVDRDPPGLVMLGPRGELEDASVDARRLLGEPVAERLPAVVHDVVARTRRGEPARASAPGHDGWLVFHGTRLGDRVALVVERARNLELAEVVVRALGLTPRERELVELVARGRSTKEIATALSISEWTVQDHLKSVFAKTGTTTRQELVAALFFGHWEPQHARAATPSPYGHYLRGK